MGRVFRFARAARLMLLAATVAGCSSIPDEYQPVIDSLHTPEMEAAIRAARQDPAHGPAPTENRSP
jgi:hypothetical protein